MSQDDYYVRSRGRVQGPFTLAALQRRLKAGTLSRFDQVSTDRQNWDPVSKLAELSELDPPIALTPEAETEPAPAVDAGPPAEPESKATRPTPAGEIESIPLAPVEGAVSPQPVLSPLGRPLPRVWVGTAVSGGVLIVLAVNMPQTATPDSLRFWWMRDVLIQLTYGVLLLLGVVCAFLPAFVRRKPEVWLAGIGGGVLVTLAVSILLASDAGRIMGSLDFAARSVAERLAVLQAFSFGTLLITALFLVVMAAAMWLPRRRPVGVEGEELYE